MSACWNILTAHTLSPKSERIGRAYGGTQAQDRRHGEDLTKGSDGC
jgi:hypothetical protein